MPQAKRWFVYENLNDPKDLLVLDEDQVVIGIYSLVGGPFRSQEDAEEFAKKRRR